MRIDELLKAMFRTYFVITTGILISMYVFCLIFQPDANFVLDDLGRILLMALAGDLPFILFYSRKELTKGQLITRFAIHIPILLSILLWFAHLWNWVNVSNPQETTIFVLLVSGVYAIVLLVNAYQDKIVADKLNESLKQRYPS